WNVSPWIPARIVALPHVPWNPLSLHGLRLLLVSMIGLCLGAASSAALSASATGIGTYCPVLRWRTLITRPSYADHDRRKRSPWRCPVLIASSIANRRYGGAVRRNRANSSSSQILSTRVPR